MCSHKEAEGEIKFSTWFTQIAEETFRKAKKQYMKKFFTWFTQIAEATDILKTFWELLEKQDMEKFFTLLTNWDKTQILQHVLLLGRFDIKV